MIKTIFISFYLLIFCVSLTANANQHAYDDASADFLEFLADVEDNTGEGFIDWLENDSADSLNIDEENRTDTRGLNE